MRRAAWTAAFLAAALAAGPDQAGAQEAARAIPADGLAVYLEWDGLGRHAEAWRKTAAYRMLTETTTAAMLEDLISQLADRAPADGQRPVSGAEVAAIARHVVEHGAALGVVGPFQGDPSAAYGVLVLREAGEGPDRAVFDRVIRGRMPRGVPSKTLTIEGREITLVRPDSPPGSWAFWTEGRDVIVTFGRAGDAPRAVVDVLKAEEGSALAHPIRKELTSGEDGFVVAARGFVDLAALPPLPPPAVQLGLDGLRRVDFRWGFRGEAIQSVSRILAPAPRQGVLAILDQPRFGVGSLPPLPGGLRSFTVIALDGGKVVDTLSAIPDARRAIEGAAEAFRNRTGLRLREDLLDVLGPRWAFYNAPQEAQTPTNPLLAMGQWVLRPPKMTSVIEVRKSDEFRQNLNELATALNEQFDQMTPGDRPAPRLKKLEDGGGYVLTIPPEVLPLPAGVRPAARVGEKFAALALTPELAQEALEAQLGDDDRAFLGDLGDDLVALSVSDPREMTPELIANLPFFLQLIGRNSRDGSARALASIRVDPELIPSPDAMRSYLFPSVTTARVDQNGLTITARQSIPSINPISGGPLAIALLLPAVQSAREAARRAQCTNNLEQIGLAFHNYHSTNNHFPAHAIYSKDGKPLLSWRVAILPYLDQQELYDEFHLDEPWDSPHNKPLIDRMPPVYACPSFPPDRQPGTTTYQGAVGPHAMFEGKEGTGLVDITDGTSNTILIAETRSRVIWTKPEDMEFNPVDDPPKLGSFHPGGADVLFGDGSVRFIKQTIDANVLKALFTRNGGEVIGGDSF